MMIEFACLVFLVACLVGFAWTLAEKWGILDWMMLHAPCEFIHKLLSCSFCRSFHLGMAISIILAIFFKEWWLVFIPFFSASIR